MTRVRVSLPGVVLLFATLSIQKIHDIDAWWQLHTGQLIVQQRCVPARDTLSYTVRGHEWIEGRWLFCALLYLGYARGGAALLILLKTAILAATYLVLVWPSRRLMNTRIGVGILALGVLAVEFRFSVRPEIFTYLFVAASLVVLDGFRRGRFTRSAWALPVCQAVWTNCHGLFILGPAAAWAFVTGELIAAAVRRRRSGLTRPSDRSKPSREHRNRDGTGAFFASEQPNQNRDRTGAVCPSRAPKLAMLAALITAACILTPYGLRGLLFPFTLFREIHAGSIFATMIGEFRSPFSPGEIWSYAFYAGPIVAIVSAGTFAWNWRRLDPARLLIWLGCAYLGAVSYRNVAIFGLVATWAALRNLDDLGFGSSFSLAGRPPRSPSGSRLNKSADPSVLGRNSAPRETSRGWTKVLDLGLAGLLVAASWYVATDRYYVAMGLPRRTGLGFVESVTPTAAADFLRRASPRPQLFHAMADGSYLTWAVADRYPVYVDGRLEVYGEEFYQTYLNSARPGGVWQAHAASLGVNSAVLKRDEFAPLIDELTGDRGWVLVHVDARDVIFVRDIPEHADLIRRYRIDPASPWTPRGPEPAETPAGWRRLIGGVAYPWHSTGMAKAFLVVGGIDNAERYLRLAVERLPTDRANRLLLAQLYRSAGRSQEANALLAGMRLSRDEQARADGLLAGFVGLRQRFAKP